MAKRKKKIIDLDSETKVIEAPEEAQIEPEIEEVEPETRTVVGSNRAESLQKEGGWLLISAIKVGVDTGGLTVKEYKFRKE